MSNYEKKGHPVAGIVLGILGILFGLTLPLLCGLIGGGIGLLLGVGAILLGVFAANSGKKTAAIILGGLAILISIFLCLTSVNLMKELKVKAEESGVAPIFSKYATNPYMGLFGILSGMPQDEASINQIMEEFDQLNKLTDTAAN